MAHFMATRSMARLWLPVIWRSFMATRNMAQFYGYP